MNNNEVEMIQKIIRKELKAEVSQRGCFDLTFITQQEPLRNFPL